MVHNILVSQKLINHYKKGNIYPRCSLKIDLHKTYDSLHWDFLKEVMDGIGFVVKFINWVITCVTSPKYSILVNGELEGYFEGNGSLR